MLEWRRPANIPYPNVWTTFKAKDLDSDELVEYRIQDVPEDRFDDVIQHMIDNFCRDENCCRVSGNIKF